MRLVYRTCFHTLYDEKKKKKKKKKIYIYIYILEFNKSQRFDWLIAWFLWQINTYWSSSCRWLCINCMSKKKKKKIRSKQLFIKHFSTSRYLKHSCSINILRNNQIKPQFSLMFNGDPFHSFKFKCFKYKLLVGLFYGMLTFVTGCYNEVCLIVNCLSLYRVILIVEPLNCSFLVNEPQY